MSSLADYVESQKEGAAQAGKFVLLDLDRGWGTPRNVGAMARFAFHFAVLALYWESGQSRLDSIEHTVLTQYRFGEPRDTVEFFGRTAQQIRWEEEDREYFARKAWGWFWLNGSQSSAAEAA